MLTDGDLDEWGAASNPEDVEDVEYEEYGEELQDPEMLVGYGPPPDSDQ